MFLVHNVEIALFSPIVGGGCVERLPAVDTLSSPLVELQ